MADSEPDIQEDIFAGHADEFAAAARQLFRARAANDARAFELTLFHFKDRLAKVLGRHLSKSDPAWDNSLHPLDRDNNRWFDGFYAEPEFPARGRLRMCGEVYWLIGQGFGHYDPLEFELELCPETGEFRRYRFRFGDSRPLAEKIKSPHPGVPVAEWAYEFEKRRN